MVPSKIKASGAAVMVLALVLAVATASHGIAADDSDLLCGTPNHALRMRSAPQPTPKGRARQHAMNWGAVGRVAHVLEAIVVVSLAIFAASIAWAIKATAVVGQTLWARSPTVFLAAPELAILTTIGMLYAGTLDDLPPGSRVTLVCRVSGEDQAKKNKTSLDDQEKRLRAWAKDRGWVVVHVIRIAKSGAKDGPQHEAIERMFAAGEIDGVCFASVDRFARNVALGLRYLYRWSDQGMRVYMGNHLFDPNEANETFVTIIHLATAQLKWAHNRNAALQKKILTQREGRWYSTNIPVGYTKDPISGQLVKDSFAPVIAQLLCDVERLGAARAAKEPAAIAITREANKRRADRYDDLQVRKPSNRQAPNELEPAEVVNDAINQPAYRGLIKYGEYYEWPAYTIGSRERWERLAKRNTRAADATQKDPLSLGLAGLAKKIGLLNLLVLLIEGRCVQCPECGDEIDAKSWKTARGVGVPRLKCSCQDGGFPEATEIDDLGPRRMCFDCDNHRMSGFSVRRRGLRSWAIRCKHCGWVARTNRFPFANGPGKFPSNPHPSQRGLDDYGDQSDDPDKS